jgi:Sulfotransferase family
MEKPVFIAGPDRSGTTLMYALLASHPDLSMVRRTNMFRYFYRQYGDISQKDNFERCLTDMVRYNRMRHLHPDPARIQEEFWAGAPTYGRLFALFHQHHAERNGKSRWGDKSLHTEHYAEGVLREFPDARIFHMIRDPRDRYASVRNRNGGNRRRFGGATGRWVMSARAGQENQVRFPGNYRIIHFEGLLKEPEKTVREICAFANLDFSPEMFSLSGDPEYAKKGGNSSFGSIKPGVISTTPVKRYRKSLSATEIAFIQRCARREMLQQEYELDKPKFEPMERLRYLALDFPFQFARMTGWMVLSSLRLRWPSGVPPARLRQIPVEV